MSFAKSQCHHDFVEAPTPKCSFSIITVARRDFANLTANPNLHLEC